jgi:predicted nuclease of restriction endonuclease-like (RecB) superfamily
MSKTSLSNNKDYLNWLFSIKSRYKQQQIKASIRVNRNLLEFYWNLGKDIVERNLENTYGSGFFRKLSMDMKKHIDDTKGFSESNLRYMHSFYSLYSQIDKKLHNIDDTQSLECADFECNNDIDESLYHFDRNLIELVKKDNLFTEILFSIPWGHHIKIINSCSGDVNKAIFYIKKTIEFNWSRSVLGNFIKTGLFEREGKAISNFQKLLSLPQGDLAQEITKDPYVFNFLSMDKNYREDELKKALIANITKFLLELGNGFAYMGREYRLVVGESEQFIDLLFYNVNLRCYVVIEVKTGDFTPAALGQLGTYVVAVNHILKKTDDNPTLGLLICKNKDNVLAKYALEASNVPIEVSEYELAKLYPVDFKSSLPSIDDIERSLDDVDCEEK